MTLTPISAITIERSERQRRELKNVDELAISITEVGLINPIVVDANFTLVAGERRLEACKTLGWDNITVTLRDDLTDAELQLLELEENVQREELDWKDHCNAIARYHELRQEEEAEWTQAKSAAALGISRANLNTRLSVQEALQEGHELVNNADKYSVARGIVERKKQRESLTQANSVNALINNTVASPDVSPQQTGVEAKEAEDGGEALGSLSSVFGFDLIHTSFYDWINTTEEKEFNFIHCDFPYGINAGTHDLGAADKFGGYEDSEDVYWTLLDHLETAVFTGVVSESSHLMFWFSMDYYTETKARLEKMGWTVNPFPLYWFKSDNSGILPDPKRGPRRNTETAFICSRGDRYIAQAVSNTFAGPNTKTIHMSEKPRDMLAHFFRMFVDGSTKMLDPTMGSANAVRVAYESGASETVGLEMNKEFYLAACHAHDDLMKG